MAFWDDWESCMDTMHMPTPSEIGHGVLEVLHKLHEAELALGGLSLHEAIEALEARGIGFHGGAATVARTAGGVTVAWWAGNAVGCLVTAAFREQITDAIEAILAPVNWSWIEPMMNEVGYPIPIPPDTEETSTSGSWTERDLFYLPYPGHEIGLRCPYSEDVKLVQSRLEAYGYDINVDGDYGDHTRAVVEHFQTSRGLKVDGVVGANTWSALFPR